MKRPELYDWEVSAKQYEVKIERTKKGLPALWEKGGGWTNTGRSQVICNRHGMSKIPVYIRRQGQLACREHALFVVEVGDMVIKAAHHRRDFSVQVYRIEKILDKEAHLTLVCSFNQGEWDIDLPQDFETAVEAAKRKAICYHCRSPYFVKEIGGKKMSETAWWENMTIEQMQAFIRAKEARVLQMLEASEKRRTQG